MKLKYHIPTNLNLIHNTYVKAFLIWYFIFSLIPLSSAVPTISIINNTKTNDTSTDKIFLNSSESISFYISSSELITTYRWYSNNTLQSNNASNFTISYSKYTYHYVKVNATNPNGTSNNITWGINVYPAIASSKISLLNETPSSDLMTAIETNDLKAFIVASIEPHTNLIGVYFYAFVWFIVFTMMWIKQQSINIPMVIGIIFGGLLITFLPAPYQLVAQVLIVLGILGAIFTFYKGRG